MTENRTLERFRKLEIPEERRSIDWSFLERPFELPMGLPLQDCPIFAVINGRVLLPSGGPPALERSILFYGEAEGLDEGETAAALEARYRASHHEALAREQRLFRDAVPPSVLGEPALLREAVALLSGSSPGPDGGLPGREQALPATAEGHLEPRAADSVLVGRIVGFSRILRIHEKLYNLLTLHEYARIFERAIEPELFASLQRNPATISPRDMLAQIEAGLEGIHAKARSPLRNKMEGMRLVVNGVTLLPLFREEAAGLFQVYGELLAVQARIEVLEGLCR